MTDLAEITRIAERLEAKGPWVSYDFRVREPTAADFLGISTRQLRTWRTEGRAPRFFLAGRLSYHISDLLNFLESRSSDFSKSLAAIGTTRQEPEISGRSALAGAA